MKRAAILTGALASLLAAPLWAQQGAQNTGDPTTTGVPDGTTTTPNHPSQTPGPSFTDPHSANTTTTASPEGKQQKPEANWTPENEASGHNPNSSYSDQTAPPQSGPQTRKGASVPPSTTQGPDAQGGSPK